MMSANRPLTPLLLEATTEFTRLADLPEGVFSQCTPDMTGEMHTNITELRKLRRKLLAEEMHEYLDGEDSNDFVEIADGLADVIVIAWGTLLAYFGEAVATEVAREVWSSNLSKVDGSLGPIQRREDGKLLKPEGWTPPDIAGVLRRHGYVSDID